MRKAVARIGDAVVLCGAMSDPLVRAFGFGALGCAVMSAAFLLPVADTWARLVAAITLLGAIGGASLGHERHALLRAALGHALLGVAAGLFVYASAWVLARIAPVAAQARVMAALPSGHSNFVIAVTVVVAAVSEELFWRATVLRLLLHRLPALTGIGIGTCLYALAHIVSGLWLLPVAALGAGVVWALLFVLTRNLTAPIASHIVFDLLVLLIPPLA